MDRQLGRLILILGLVTLRPAWAFGTSLEPPEIRTEKLPEVGRSVADGEDRVTLAGREQWAAVFGDREEGFHFAVRTREPIKGRVAWTFSVERLTVSRGEAAFSSDSNRPAQIDVRLSIPAVKDNVIVQAHLSVSVFAEGQPKAEAVLDKAIWIFPSDPFVNRRNWLKELKITLFDPEERTAQILQKLNIPFDETRNVAAIGELTSSTVTL